MTPPPRILLDAATVVFIHLAILAAFASFFGVGAGGLWLVLPGSTVGWLLTCAFTVLALITGFLFRAPHPRRADLCPTCGYDLRATPIRCPECGTTRSL